MPGLFGAMRDWLRSSTSDRTPSAQLALFGKHPGWNDHIDDIGLRTDELVAVRRTLYSSGIASNIESGYWDKLPPDQRVDGFGHAFLWQFDPTLMYGRMWPSSDGKGRTRYPMVACIQFDGVPPVDGVRLGEAFLGRLGEECLATHRAEIVQGAVERIQSELAREVAALSLDAKGHAHAVVALRETESLRGGGLERVMYRLDPHKTGMLDDAQSDLRVPGLSARDSDLAMWCLFLSMWGGSQSRLLIQQLSHGWIDLLLGDVKPQDLSCLLRSPQSLPLTTDVPYSLDPAFVAWAEQALEQASR